MFSTSFHPKQILYIIRSNLKQFKRSSSIRLQPPLSRDITALWRKPDDPLAAFNLSDRRQRILNWHKNYDQNFDGGQMKVERMMRPRPNSFTKPHPILFKRR